MEQSDDQPGRAVADDQTELASPGAGSPFFLYALASVELVWLALVVYAVLYLVR